jgi:hypothetical protein
MLASISGLTISCICEYPISGLLSRAFQFQLSIEFYGPIPAGVDTEQVKKVYFPLNSDYSRLKMSIWPVSALIRLLYLLPVTATANFIQ